MTSNYSRRQAIKAIAATSAAAAFPRALSADSDEPKVAARDAEVRITSISAHTFRLSLLPIKNGIARAIPDDGSLLRTDWGTPTASIRGPFSDSVVPCGNWRIAITRSPLAFTISDSKGAVVQRIRVDEQTGDAFFLTGNSPLLGLGEGGPQFDRRGSIDEMRSGQGGYKLGTHGGRVPIPWVIATEGWAMFFHQPFGTFDFSGSESKFQPANVGSALPLDIFFVASREPATIKAEYARLTGLPELPPLWSFGYQQSHRTLTGREEVLAEA